jgi:hypothetical protein
MEGRKDVPHTKTARRIKRFLPKNLCCSASSFSLFVSLSLFFLSLICIYFHISFPSLFLFLSLTLTYFFFIVQRYIKHRVSLRMGFFARSELLRARALERTRARKRRWSLWERPGWHQAEEVFNISTIFYPLKFPQSIWGVFEKCCANSDFCSTINHIYCPHNQHLMLKATLRSKNSKCISLKKRSFWSLTNLILRSILFSILSKNLLFHFTV